MGKEIFDSVLKTFENEDIKAFAVKCIDAAPKYFYSVPASSSGKYHPNYALGDGGLARHTVALVRILNHMLEVESVANQFTSRERDLLRVAGIAHDMMKSGTQEEYAQSKWTKFDHPLLAAKMVWNLEGLSDEERKQLSWMISSHMGQWCTDKRNPDVVLPKPESKYQIIIHLADYLASRKDIEILFDEKDMPNANGETPTHSNADETPDVNTWKLPFGKFKGETLIEVKKKAPWYIKWAKENVDKEPFKSLVQGL